MGRMWHRLQAICLLTGILVVLGSAAWHVHAAAASGDEDGSGNCPICLSQRSLDQCSVETQTAIAAPCETAPAVASSPRRILEATSRASAAPRAPPSA